MTQLVHLFLLLFVNSVTWLGIFILLIRTLGSLFFNTTTIESWEIERHETLVRRARVLGGSLEGPGGVKIAIRKQEFPYDIGFFSNIVQGMGDSINVSPPFVSAYLDETHTALGTELVLAIRRHPESQSRMGL